MTDLPADLNASLLAAAHAAADAARRETLRYFRRTGLVAENKADRHFDPVTAADRAAELAIREVLGRMRPEDAILGEEFPFKPGTSGLTWVLDPIDGTRGYISGTPTWGVLIAVRDQSSALLGVIDQPYIGERFVGGLGIASVTGPQGSADLKTGTRKALADSILFTTFPEVGTLAEGAAFRALSGQVRLTRYGMDCYAYALLAAGQVDLVVEAGLHTYDVLAPIAVIEAAGGIVTNWQGAPALEGGQILAAANADLHAAAMQALAAIAG